MGPKYTTPRFICCPSFNSFDIDTRRGKSRVQQLQSPLRIESIPHSVRSVREKRRRNSAEWNEMTKLGQKTVLCMTESQFLYIHSRVRHTLSHQYYDIAQFHFPDFQTLCHQVRRAFVGAVVVVVGNWRVELCHIVNDGGMMTVMIVARVAMTVHWTCACICLRIMSFSINSRKNYQLMCSVWHRRRVN